MELRQLRHFMAVITHGSFTAAARAELIVQSALSTSVRNLERELGAARAAERRGRRYGLSARSSRSARWSATSCGVRGPSGRYQVDRWWTEPKW